MNDLRYLISRDYYELVNNWNKNNMLYNSLRFYQIYNLHIERSDFAKNFFSKVINEAENDFAPDIMTGWWLPLKWFLFRTKDGNRDHRTAELIEIIPAKNDISILTEELSILRHGSSTVLSENVVKELLAFLCVIYSEGNLTSVARTNKLGPLDGWNSKLEDLKKQYHDIDKWVKFVEDNCFEMFFQDVQYTKIKEYWQYGSINLCDASDDDWKTYFLTAKELIVKRHEQLKKKYNI